MPCGQPKLKAWSTEQPESRTAATRPSPASATMRPRRGLRVDRRAPGFRTTSLATTWCCLLSSVAAHALAWQGVPDVRTVLDHERAERRVVGRWDSGARTR